MPTNEMVFLRPFQVWLYSVSHSQLLLRSNRSDEWSTRVDILFKVVRAMQLPTSFEQLRIVEASKEEARAVADKFGIKLFTDSKVFMLNTGSCTGLVVAPVVFVHEDEGHCNDPSYFEKSFRESVRP